MPIDLKQPDETRCRVRKLLYASRGINLIFVGLWMCLQTGLQFAQVAEPAWKAVSQLGMLFGLVLLLLSLRWIHLARAQKECHAEGRQTGSVGSEIKLFSVIALGVLAATAICLLLPQIGEAEGLAPIMLCFWLLLAGGYFVYEAMVLKLIELAILGLVFGIGGVCALRMAGSISTEMQIQYALLGTQSAVGLVMLGLGASLHRRWRFWREQVLSA